MPRSDAEPLDIELLDTDLSTVTSQSDRVLKVLSPSPHLQHIELETGHHGSETADNLLLYSALLRKKYKLPVRSTVILLRREADSPALTGVLQYHVEEELYLQFEYNVARVWHMAVKDLLAGGIGTLPLAPLADISADQLPGVIRQMQIRVEAEVTIEEEQEIWTSTRILMGLRYPQALTDQALRGIRQMRESVTYQAILEEGREEGRKEGRVNGERTLLIRVGSRRLGIPSARILEALQKVVSSEKLIELGDRLMEVETWDDLIEGF